MTTAIESPDAPRRYPLYVVAGAKGSGKTSLLNALLALRPAHERWALLLNEEGHSQVNATSDASVTVKDASGACACCTGQVVFVTSLAALIRQTRPHRVFVESSGQASLASLLQSLRGSFEKAVNVERVVTLLHRTHAAEVVATPRQLDLRPPNGLTAELTAERRFHADQHAHANVVIVHGPAAPREGADSNVDSDLEALRARSGGRMVLGWPDVATLRSLLADQLDPVVPTSSLLSS